MEADQDELGPVDVAVIAYPAGSPMSGEALDPLLSLVDRGIIRVLDAMFVIRDEDGRVSGFEAKNLDDQHVGGLRVLEGASSGLLGEADIATAGEALDPGSAAVAIVYENRWAAPLVSAIRRNGGVPVAFERVAAEDLDHALAALGVAA